MEICDAMLDFNNDEGNFCFCELEKGHEGNHRALMFEWQGEGTTIGTEEDRLMGKHAIKCLFDHHFSKEQRVEE